MYVLQHPKSYPNKEQIKALGGEAQYERQRFVGWALPTPEAYERALALCEGTQKSQPQKSVSKKRSPTPMVVTQAPVSWGGKLKTLTREQVEALLPVHGYDLTRIWKDEMGEWIIRMARENIQLGHPIAPPDWLEKTYPSAKDLFEAFPDGARSNLVILSAAAALVAGEAWLEHDDFQPFLAMNARKLGVSVAELEGRARAVIEAYQELDPNSYVGIKAELFNYLQEVGCIKAKKQQEAWQFVGECAKSGIEGEFLQEALSSYFSAPHHNVVTEFIHRYEAVYLAEIDRMMEEEEANEEVLSSQRYWEKARDDWEYEELCPAAEIRIAPDRIEVQAFETGVGERLPKVKGRKYQGDLLWTFPLSAREKLEKTGFPVLFYPGFERN